MQVHLVDGTYELFRYHFALPSHVTKAGQEVGATRGFMRSMLGMLRDPEVTHVGVAFDTVIESFRNRMFAGYKTGEGIEPELKSQFPLIEEAAEALGLVVWRMVEFEADELLARLIQHELDHLDGILVLDHLDEDTRREAKRALRRMQMGEVVEPDPAPKGIRRLFN